MLVLYTDGVIEARSPAGAFYPLAERVAYLRASGPDALLHQIHRDLIPHTGGPLDNDAALLIIERTPPTTSTGRTSLTALRSLQRAWGQAVVVGITAGQWTLCVNWGGRGACQRARHIPARESGE